MIKALDNEAKVKPARIGAWEASKRLTKRTRKEACRPNSGAARRAGRAVRGFGDPFAGGGFRHETEAHGVALRHVAICPALFAEELGGLADIVPCFGSLDMVGGDGATTDGHGAGAARSR